MAQYADGAFVTRFQNHIQKLEIFFALAQLQDLTVLLIAHAIHAVDVHTEKPGLNAFEQRQEIIDVIVPMVQVVNNTHIGFFDLLKDLRLIFGLAKPTAMIVEAYTATDFPGSFCNGSDLIASGLYFGRLIFARCGVAHRDPKLGMNLIAFECFQNLFRLRAEGCRKPECAKLYTILFEFCNFLIEGGDVFITPIVGKFGEPKILEHLGAIDSVAFLGIEWNDAPSHEVIFTEKHIRGRLLGWFALGS